MLARTPLYEWERSHLRGMQDAWLATKAAKAPAPKPKLRALNKDKRRHLVETVAAILKTGKPTHFSYEAPCRHGLRSSLCLEGWGWQDADGAAADIVAAALRSIGAQRPTWQQGQPEYREAEFFGTYRHCGNPKCRAMLEEDQRIFCSAHCASYVAKERWRKRNEEELRIAARLRARNRTPEALRESRLRAQEKWDLKDCKTCGKQFKAHPGRDSQYCSKACYWEPNQNDNPDRACVHCAAMFRDTKKSSTKRFCSTDCFYEWTRKETEKKSERQCPICSSIFRVRSPSEPKITCSRRCGAIARERGIRRPSKKPEPPAFFCEAAE